MQLINLEQVHVVRPEFNLDVMTRNAGLGDGGQGGGVGEDAHIPQADNEARGRCGCWGWLQGWFACERVLQAGWRKGRACMQSEGRWWMMIVLAEMHRIRPEQCQMGVCDGAV